MISPGDPYDGHLLMDYLLTGDSFVLVLAAEFEVGPKIPQEM